MYPFLSVFGFDISMYGVMALVGILVSAVYVYFTNRGGRAGSIPKVDITHIFVFAVLGAVAGGKMLGAFTAIPIIVKNWAALSQNFFALVSVLFSPFVFYGGMLGGLLAVTIYCKNYKLSIKDIAGVMTPIIPLFHVFGRIGCFLSGCCWGIEVHWGIEYTHSLGAPNGVPLLPIQLIESGFNLLIFIFLAVLSRRLLRKWLVLPIYFLSYGTARFIIEFFRGDAIRGIFWIFSTSQWVSLALICVAIFILVREFCKKIQRPF